MVHINTPTNDQHKSVTVIDLDQHLSVVYGQTVPHNPFGMSVGKRHLPLVSQTLPGPCCHHAIMYQGDDQPAASVRGDLAGQP